MLVYENKEANDDSLTLVYLVILFYLYNESSYIIFPIMLAMKCFGMLLEVVPKCISRYQI